MSTKERDAEKLVHKDDLLSLNPFIMSHWKVHVKLINKLLRRKSEQNLVSLHHQMTIWERNSGNLCMIGNDPSSKLLTFPMEPLTIFWENHSILQRSSHNIVRVSTLSWPIMNDKGSRIQYYCHWIRCINIEDTIHNMNKDESWCPDSAPVEPWKLLKGVIYLFWIFLKQHYLNKTTSVMEKR